MRRLLLSLLGVCWMKVETRADPPVCKIMDFHKEKYKKELREKEKLKIKSDKTLRADSKEVKFYPKTEAKDLKMKVDMVKRFMEKGYRVKCIASDAKNKELGELFSRLTVLIEDVALIECEPTLGKRKEAFIMVKHVKFGPSKKGGVIKKKAVEKTIALMLKRRVVMMQVVLLHKLIFRLCHEEPPLNQILVIQTYCMSHLQERTQLHCPHKSLLVRLKINTKIMS